MSWNSVVATEPEELTSAKISERFSAKTIPVSTETKYNNRLKPAGRSFVCLFASLPGEKMPPSPTRIYFKSNFGSFILCIGNFFPLPPPARDRNANFASTTVYPPNSERNNRTFRTIRAAAAFSGLSDIDDTKYVRYFNIKNICGLWGKIYIRVRRDFHYWNSKGGNIELWKDTRWYVLLLNVVFHSIYIKFHKTFAAAEIITNSQLWKRTTLKIGIYRLARIKKSSSRTRAPSGRFPSSRAFQNLDEHYGKIINFYTLLYRQKITSDSFKSSYMSKASIFLNTNSTVDAKGWFWFTPK